MITAQARHYPTFMTLEIIFPDRKEREFAKADNAIEAQKLLNYKNQQYIVKKLKSWLNQRQIAIRYGMTPKDPTTSARLYVLLGFYERQRAFHGLCSFIAEHKSFFVDIAPPETSNQFNYYNTIIRPILTFCEEMCNTNIKK
ncbi:hypothetical protein KHS38_11950 [Mucilaginibacter sp. Bleaf8]|uniref:hypothetical protein n=1 Tax=Mucilaginibacter sp. Bleaf8 TaxID=2834430 RepID=UPI001BCB4D88|nr:hypothetical protein [Mucilaginibacter sp. Bleaf8]MBS7565119.1 hypothetical protein [Mucilaginibacter sp. Bleaf8]